MEIKISLQWNEDEFAMEIKMSLRWEWRWVYNGNEDEFTMAMNKNLDECTLGVGI